MASLRAISFARNAQLESQKDLAVMPVLEAALKLSSKIK